MSLGAPDTGQAGEVNPTEACTLVGVGAVLVDVRETDEIAQGHAEGIVAMPLSLLGDHLDELPGDRTLVIVCRSGSRSAIAAKALSDAGYTAVNLAGGMEAWRDAGLAVVRDNGSPGFVA